MERQYNLELFHRRGRRIELSDVGRQLLPIAQAMAALDLDAHNLLRDSGRLDSGELRLGQVGPFHVIEMVDHYLQRHPRIDVSIRVGNSAQVLADLEALRDGHRGAGRSATDDPALCAALRAPRDHPVRPPCPSPGRARLGAPRKNWKARRCCNASPAPPPARSSTLLCRPRAWCREST